MFTLIIGDEEERYWDDNLLFINYKARSHTFNFEHRTLSGKNDKKVCTESEALETLRLFLKYKFAVLLNPSAKDCTSSAY